MMSRESRYTAQTKRNLALNVKNLNLGSEISNERFMFLFLVRVEPSGSFI